MAGSCVNDDITGIDTIMTAAFTSCTFCVFRRARRPNSAMHWRSCHCRVSLMPYVHVMTVLLHCITVRVSTTVFTQIFPKSNILTLRLSLRPRSVNI